MKYIEQRSDTCKKFRGNKKGDGEKGMEGGKLQRKGRCGEKEKIRGKR